ncbi:MAG: STAS domain-containing protein [Phycisphaeraceae bacterium]
MTATRSGFAVQQVGNAVAIQVNRAMVSPDSLEGFGQTLDSLIATSEEPRIIIDLVGVEFLPTAMLGHLISASTKLRRKDCRLRLVGVNEHIQGVLHVTRVKENFDIFDSQDNALESFGKSGGAGAAAEGA